MMTVVRDHRVVLERWLDIRLLAC